MKKLKVSEKYVVLGLLPILLIAGIFYLNVQTNRNPVTEIRDQSNQLEAKFASLSNAGTNFCAGPNFIGSLEDGDRLQGSCCAPIDFDRYVEQIEGLKKYANISIIPSDPYDIPAPLAKEMLDYDKTYVLTAEQQTVYDNAMKMSDEHGPCCCKCWRWAAFEGQAKYLIKNLDFTEKQIAGVWDLEDGCGGRENNDRQIRQPTT